MNSLNEFMPYVVDHSFPTRRSSDLKAELTVRMEATEDVLSALSQSRRADQTLVGFAAETGAAAVEYGRGKLERKGLDAIDRKSTRLNSSHPSISYAVFCMKKKTKEA